MEWLDTYDQSAAVQRWQASRSGGHCRSAGPATAASRALLPLAGLPRRTAQTTGAESGPSTHFPRKGVAYGSSTENLSPIERQALKGSPIDLACAERSVLLRTDGLPPVIREPRLLTPRQPQQRCQCCGDWGKVGVMSWIVGRDNL